MNPPAGLSRSLTARPPLDKPDGSARIAQLDRALASGAKGHRFESCCVYHLATKGPLFVAFFLCAVVHCDRQPASRSRSW